MVDRDELDEWFYVIDDDIDDGDEQPDDEPELAGAAAAFLRKLRDQVPTLRSLGIRDADDTYAAYGNGRLYVVVNVVDIPGGMQFGSVRAEVSDAGWLGAWVSPTLGDESNIADANPILRAEGSVDDAEQGSNDAVEWLMAQLRRPVKRYVWREGGQVVGRCWRLEDTGDLLAGPNPPDLAERLDTADEAKQIRP